MIASLFYSSGIALAVVGWVAIFRHAAPRTVSGWFAMANGLFVVANALAGDRLMGCVSAALCAYSAWSWWRSGGGDGTKRRLKSWARKFRGVRRAAPVAGEA